MTENSGCSASAAPVAARGIFSFFAGATSQGLGDEVPQKLKQFADIVYRFRLQKRSEFNNFTL